jgi:hypothetical protein
MTDDNVLVLTIQEFVPAPVCPVCGYGLTPLPYSRKQAWWCERAFSDVGTAREHTIGWHVDAATGEVTE